MHNNVLSWSWRKYAKGGESRKEFYDRALEELKDKILNEIIEQKHQYRRHFHEVMERLDIELSGRGEFESGTIGSRHILDEIEIRILYDNGLGIYRN